jgi:hypothetical protein
MKTLRTVEKARMIKRARETARMADLNRTSLSASSSPVTATASLVTSADLPMWAHSHPDQSYTTQSVGDWLGQQDTAALSLSKNVAVGVGETRKATKQPPAKRANPFERPSMLGAVSHPVQ